ncbi:cryptochrome/photolyase family protein [Paenibacillus arenilitoris]|uniref:Deoxyribodipyrimidine photo-lyase n=1 Tax=Paenibacillus arenilitoris TaxID=2772299 RepID=A0A927CP81_9BACL|nr:deoxyribodipyrimidine photo-lyase [Paenibacillus arenilitoris]MBD2871634.1 deoxyribodipyrimidine photo-lyase [Paenibacillus arenilitoris]
MYLFIHRKDLRTTDMRAFDYLRSKDDAGIHLLILDPALVGGGRLTSHSGRSFIGQAASLLLSYADAGKELHVLYGEPERVTEALLQAHPIEEVVVHDDYTPYARLRDERLRELARKLGRSWTPVADAPLADMTAFPAYARRSGSVPYKVFTPFYRKWNRYIAEHYGPASDIAVDDLATVREIDPAVAAAFALPEPVACALGASSGVEGTAKPSAKLDRFIRERLAAYAYNRDNYAEDATSGLARFMNAGSISVRQAYEATQGLPGAENWLRQLAWRDFFLYQAIYHEDFFRYEHLTDLSPLSDVHFEAWASGSTGIPLIDAAMTQLNRTGELPNRLRMIVAMFLTKNLLCPFTLGEQHFRLHLSDYDNAQNRGGWLWCSSLGYDAAPYFRVMNPVSQSQRYDPDGSYIRRWLPHLAHLSDKEIHRPLGGAIVDLKASRARAIDVYKTIVLAGAGDERRLMGR